MPTSDPRFNSRVPKTGTLVFLDYKYEGRPIHVRRAPMTREAWRDRNPGRAKQLDESSITQELTYQEKIEPGTWVLYLSTCESLPSCIQNGQPPLFHLVLWKGKAVWVSSEDAVVVEA